MLPVALAVLVYVHLFYVAAVLLKNFAIMDIAWGSGFILVALVSYLTSPLTMKSSLLLFMAVIWGLRLTLHIYRRSRGAPEDSRYAELRQLWGKRANLEAYFKIFLFQGVLLLIVSLPISQGMGTEFQPWNWAGVFIWFIGMAIETWADMHLTYFKSNSKDKGSICMSGPWKFSRFPNYFGEILLWYGVWMTATSGWNAWTIVGPVTLNLLILRLTGIPPLEQKYQTRADYISYSARVPRLVPFTRPRQLIQK